jgi:serine/threonine protein kinase
MGADDVINNSSCRLESYVVAPEMYQQSGHTRSIDWYMLGALIYEMLVGIPPYFNKDKTKMVEEI